MENRVLKARIVERYGSQANFSAATKIDESVISRIIKGRRELTPEQKLAWADRLGAPVKDLFPERTS
jgi:plasmid maintenance system antidote protein VapI